MQTLSQTAPPTAGNPPRTLSASAPPISPPTKRMTAAASMVEFLDKPPQERFLRQKFQVGSCKSERRTFPLSQKVFHSGDVPKGVSAAKKEVQRSCRPDILNMDRQPWDQSTISDPKIQATQFVKKDKRKNLKAELLLVRAGLMDEKTVPKSKNSDREEEQVRDYVRHVTSLTGKGPIGALTKKWFNSVDERGIGAHCVEPKWPDWNCSVGTRSAEDVKVKEKRFEENEIRRKDQNVVNKRYNKNIYVTPTQQVTEANEAVAEKKQQYQDLKEEFKANLRHEHPQASEERLQALAQRLLDEKLLADEKIRRFPQEHENHRPNLALTTQDRRYKEWSHNGVWTWIPSENQFAWSDNMSYDKNDKGCEYSTVNPDGWTYHSGARMDTRN
jgi:hypothetical protein